MKAPTRCIFAERLTRMLCRGTWAALLLSRACIHCVNYSN